MNVTPDLSREDASMIVQQYGNRASRRRWAKIEKKRDTQERLRKTRISERRKPKV